ncbi:fibronectin type III domain-containing protein [Bryobacter aggregatus]|uniref:fibronectin type III domain-containing protein n=1 Tax=Bryobacter aggregatus TaxID=360054 RepID=UPI0004E225AF|nr:hypothetical protein [Bryobacter aggregatus]
MRHCGVLILAALSLGSCGYVGDPMPPALKIPMAVTDLSIAQVGPNLLVHFTIPPKTMEGLPLERLGAIELKIGASPAPPFQVEAWSNQARVVDVSATAPGIVHAKIPVKDWANQEVVVGVRVANQKMRVSPWSNFATLQVLPALEIPADFRAAASATGVELDWSEGSPRPGLEWRIFRQGPDEKEATEIANVSTPKFSDSGAQHGQTYRYSILSVLGKATSERSEAITITPVDTFAPATPSGLSALAAPAAVQLSWERNRETDLAFYRVYRSVDGGPLVKIAELPSAANFRDTDVKPGFLYRYSVSASDQKGNESPKSEPVEIRIP